MMDDHQQDDKVDKELVAMFLGMTPEERVSANDNAALAVKELRHAFLQQRKSREPGAERTS
jgi:hypothetical protein